MGQWQIKRSSDRLSISEPSIQVRQFSLSGQKPASSDSRDGGVPDASVADQWDPRCDAFPRMYGKTVIRGPNPRPDNFHKIFVAGDGDRGFVLYNNNSSSKLEQLEIGDELIISDGDKSILSGRVVLTISQSEDGGNAQKAKHAGIGMAVGGGIALIGGTVLVAGGYVVTLPLLVKAVGLGGVGGFFGYTIASTSHDFYTDESNILACSEEI